MNKLLLLCLHISLFALIPPTASQDETEVYKNYGTDNQNNGDNYQNHGVDYQNNRDYQNNGADYQKSNNHNNGLEYEDEARSMDSSELQHFQNMRQEMAVLNRRLKPPSLRNSQGLELELGDGEQSQRNNRSTIRIPNDSTCKAWGPWSPCKPMGVSMRCQKEKLCINGQGGEPYTEECPGLKPPMCDQGVSCSKWSQWSPCQELDSLGKSVRAIPGGQPNGTSCKKKKVCIGNLSSFKTEECPPGVKPPLCDGGGTGPPMGNCTSWEYGPCGPNCKRCGCCLEPLGFVGVGEWGCEPCTGGRCEPRV